MSKTITLNSGQQSVLEAFKAFVSDNSHRVFILKGYAGTGKTTLVRFILDYLRGRKLRYKLLAPTGRAAKILSDLSSSEASTIHSHIYVLDDFNQDVDEVLKLYFKGRYPKEDLLLRFRSKVFDNKEVNHLYIVDEASMVSDKRSNTISQAIFGQGRVLKDLMTYAPHSQFLFVGDECQLPPVGQNISPALSVEYFHNEFGLSAVEYRLTDIVRQEADNGIVHVAHKVREMVEHPPKEVWAKLPLRNNKDITIHPDLHSLRTDYFQSIRNGDFKRTTYIASSNKSCFETNWMIRNTLGLSSLRESELLMVNQNNLITGLLNGDLVQVAQVGQAREQCAQLTFLPVEVRRITDGSLHKILLVEDMLYGRYPNLTSSQQKTLYIDFFKRLHKRGIKKKSEEFKEELRSDPYLNALRATFGYALTCHKSQGGEWEEVFLEINRGQIRMPNDGTYKWLYTGITRAQKRLHVADDFYLE